MPLLAKILMGGVEVGDLPSGHERLTDRKERESLDRKVDIVLSVSGQGDEQLNVLINSLARVTLAYEVEMASVMQTLCTCYLENLRAFREQRRKYEEGEDDE